MYKKHRVENQYFTNCMRSIIIGNSSFDKNKEVAND